MINEKIGVYGQLTMVLSGPDGAVKEKVVLPNKVVTSGTYYIASRIANAATTAIGFMGIGTGTTAPAAGDVNLQTEVLPTATTGSGGTLVTAGQRATAAASPSSNTVVYTATFNPGYPTLSAGTTSPLSEAALFNYNTSGTSTAANNTTTFILAHTTFNTINKGPNDTLTITWTITVVGN